MAFAILTVVAAGGCTRLGFGEPMASDSSASHDGGHQLDATVDAFAARDVAEAGPGDASPGDADPGDADPGDADASTILSCAAPQVIGGAPVELFEAGLRADGLTLVARAGAQNHYVTSRPTVSGAFGPWQLDDELPPGGDPLFFRDQAQIEWLVYSLSPVPRTLRVCREPFSAGCSELTLLEAGVPITTDVDGPDIVNVAGALLMTLSVDDVLYTGVPEVAGGGPEGTWVVQKVNLPGELDDPALGPEGLLMLHGIRPPQGSWDIAVAQRPSLTAPFAASEPLGALNSPAMDLDPVVRDAGGGVLEVFFRSDRSGVGEIYRSTCLR